MEKSGICIHSNKFFSYTNTIRKEADSLQFLAEQPHITLHECHFIATRVRYIWKLVKGLYLLPRSAEETATAKELVLYASNCINSLYTKIKAAKEKGEDVYIPCEEPISCANLWIHLLEC